MKKLEGKIALVTGGSRGIGAAVVHRLATEGANVAFTYSSSPERAENVVKAVQGLGVRSVAIQADSADAKAVVGAVERAAKELGGLDILVNNAGVLTVGPIDTFALADFDRTLAVNIRAVFVAIQAAIKHMKSGGRIINIGSCNAERMPFAGGGVYAMSKSALQGLVQGLSRDLGPRGITINNVQPGPIDTEMNPANGENAEGLKS
jgi:3-oxoacyl-[acyl-carrier protein] reductase